MKTFRKIIEFVLSAIFPDRCSVCDEVVETDSLLCDKCRSLIFPIVAPLCHKCGVSLGEHDDKKCREISASVIAAYYYRGSVRNLIIDFKETKSRKYFRFFELAFYEKIATEYADEDFDIAVCVPSSEKGKTTSSIIAGYTAEKFLLDFDKDVLEKYRETEKQHKLSMEERFVNLENSIRVRNGMEEVVKNKRILLCDDVKTTGTTLNECVKALYNAGAMSVCCACLAVSDYTVKDK